MLVLVSYDVATSTETGKYRLRNVAKICLNYGQRVQYSVFECIVDPAQLTKLRHELVETIDPEKDSLRFYFLGANWQRRIEHVGAKKVVDLERDSLII